MLLLLAVLCTAPLIAARSIAAGVVCSLLAGVTIAPLFSCQYALVGRSVSAGSETEAFTWISAALIGGLAAGSALGGAVIGLGGVSAPFLVACLATTLAALLACRSQGTQRSPAGVTTSSWVSARGPCSTRYETARATSPMSASASRGGRA